MIIGPLSLTISTNALSEGIWYAEHACIILGSAGARLVTWQEMADIHLYPFLLYKEEQWKDGHF